MISLFTRVTQQLLCHLVTVDGKAAIISRLVSCLFSMSLISKEAKPGFKRFIELKGVRVCSKEWMHAREKTFPVGFVLI